MGKYNIFVDAYLRNRHSRDFWVDFDRQILRGRKPLIRTGKLEFKDDFIFRPINYLKPHIFINDGE